MLNFLKMDLYRIIRSVMTWVILLIAVVNAFLTVYFMRLELNVNEHNNSVEQSVDRITTTLKQGVEYNPSHLNGYDVRTMDLFSRMIRNGNVLILLTIYCVMFVNSENKSGFIKNIAGQLSNSGQFIIPRLIIFAFYSGLLLITSLIMAIAGQLLLFGNSDLRDISSILPFLGTQWILHAAFGALISCIITIFRNTITSLTLGLFIASGLFELTYVYVMKLVNISESRASGLLFSGYLVDGNIRQLPLVFEPIIYRRALIISAVFLIAMTGINIYVTHKRDII